jgi:NADH:ubiquinone oxidoreductase subunit B-like Fe-S oxidoreductase
MRDYWERHNPIVAEYNAAIERVTKQAARPQWTIKMGPPTNDGDLRFVVPNQVRKALDGRGEQ